MDSDEATDYQIESQRGMFICGVPVFTANWLIPYFDPYPYTDLEGKPTGLELRQMQVPNPEWEWEWPNWVVDMTDHVDYHGWSYNFCFTKYHWHDGSAIGRCFVRQRRWMRKRNRVQLKRDNESDNMLDALGLLSECRNDRERTEALVNYITEDTVEGLVDCSSVIIGKYQFPQSVEKLKEKLRQTAAGQRFVDSIE